MSQKPDKTQPRPPKQAENSKPGTSPKPETREIGGREGPDPVRYGDWEIGGKCVDF